MLKNIQTKILPILGLFLSMTMPVISADLFQSDRFMLSGFGTLGLTSSGSDELGFRRDATQKEEVYHGDVGFLTDSRAGIQVNAKLNPQFNAAVQLVVKERISHNIDKLLELAFLSYRPTNNLELRFGRLKGAIYMLSEYRDVGFAYLWARPVSEFYGYFLFQSADGMDVQYSMNTPGGGFLQLKAFGGYTHINAPFGDTEWNTGSIPAYGLNLNFEKNNWIFRAGWARAEFEDGDLTIFNDLKDPLQSIPSFLWPDAQGLADKLSYDDSFANFYSLGMTYDNGQWVVQSELGMLNSSKAILPTTMSGYLSLGYRVGKFTPYVVASFIDSTKDRYSSPEPFLPSLQPLHEVVVGAINESRASQNTISVGTRWDLSRHTALKFQWDVRHIKGGEAVLWRLAPQDDFFTKDQTVNTFSINLDFIF